MCPIFDAFSLAKSLFHYENKSLSIAKKLPKSEAMKKNWPPIREVRYPNGSTVYVVDARVKGAGKRHFFEIKKDAETKARQLRVERLNQGTAAINFPERLRVEALECEEKLKPFGKSLRDAVGFYLPHLEASNKTCTINDLKDKLLASKKQDGKSDRYLADLRSRIGQFARYFDSKPVSEFTFTDVDTWLRSLGLGIVSRNNFRRALVIAFNFAKEHGYCASNPAEKTKAPAEPRKTVEVLSIKQAADLLAHADEKIIPAIALGLFAGLRPESERNLDWSQIDFEDKQIDINERNTKRPESQRYIDMSDNLIAWLQPHRKLRGPVFPSIDVYYELLVEARKKAGIKQWPHDALRHSFGTYHYGAHQNAALTMTQMGHTNPKTFFKHYRRKTKQKDALPYWQIMPEHVSEKVVAFAGRA
jgi:integrase